jgi:hypothetical protein
MPVNFDEAIAFSGNTVVAIGPEDPQERIKEICVWIYRSLPNNAGDAAATEMSTHTEGEEHPPHFLRVDGPAAGDPGRWLLPVRKISEKDFQQGKGVAFGIALTVNKVTGKEQVRWWAQGIELQHNPDRVEAANNALLDAANTRVSTVAATVLGPGGKLADPLPPEGLN